MTNLTDMNYFNAFEDDNPRQIGNTEVIYSKTQRLYFKCKGKEDRQRDVRVILELLTGISPVSEKSLSMKLTDDEDPFFFFSMLITEDDFKYLKAQQGLLIDFMNFPGQLVLLLQQCKSGPENQNAKFLLLLDEDGTESMLDGVRTYLKFVEKNQFKQLCHLSLRIGGGNDEEVKQYMAFQIKHLKDVVMKTEKKLLQSEASLTNTLSELKATCKNLDEMKKEWSEEKNLLQIQYMKELSNEREQIANMKLQWQKEEERSKKEDEKHYMDVIRDLESQISELKCTNQKNFEKFCQANLRNRELADELTSIQNEFKILKQDMLAIRKQNAKLDTDYHEKERVLIQLRTENTALEQELREKTVLINKQQEQIYVLNERKTQLKERLEEKDLVLKKKNTNIEALTKDLLKANEILARLQSQQSGVASKLKLRTNITMEQEKLLEKKQRELIDCQEEFRNCQEMLHRIEESEKNHKELLVAANAKLEEKEKILRNNDNVISWLNRKLTEAQFKPSQITGKSYIRPGSTSTPYQDMLRPRDPNMGGLRQFQPIQHPYNEPFNYRSAAASVTTRLPYSLEDLKNRNVETGAKDLAFKDMQTNLQSGVEKNVKSFPVQSSASQLSKPKPPPTAKDPALKHTQTNLQSGVQKNAKDIPVQASAARLSKLKPGPSAYF